MDKINNRLIRFLVTAGLLSLTCLSITHASGTYVPPITSFGTIDNRYNMGKEYLFGSRGVGGGPSCASCHSSFQRSSLLGKQNQLSSIIANCSGPHKVYCAGGRSNLGSGTVSTIVYTLKVRYNLGR